MMGRGNARLTAIQFGIFAGLMTVVLYPLLLFAPLPDLATTIAAAMLGPMFVFGSWGLRVFLTLDKRTTAGDLAMLCNALAGALFTAMLLVQLAVKSVAIGSVELPLVGVWLGLDVAWDTYGGLGTILFSLAASWHPRLGRVVGVSGLVVAAALLALNYYSFPTPPGEAGLIDLGPLVALWYLVVTLMVWRSLGWARARILATTRERN